MQTKNVFFFAIIIAALLWLFLSKSEPVATDNEALVSQTQNTTINSVVQPVKSDVIKVIEVSENSAPIELNDEARIEAQAQFKQATEFVQNQQWQKAEALYLELIEKLPLAIEPYINLSAVYAETDRMDEAREVLLIGVKANPNYAILFNNLQSIHGALAAEAYRIALASDEEGDLTIESESLELDLPMISAIDLRRVDLSRQQELLSQVAELQQTQRQEESAQLSSLTRIAELEKELAAATNQNVAIDDTQLSRVAELEEQIKQQQAQLKLRDSELKIQADALALVEQELLDVKQAMSIEVAAVQEPLTGPVADPVADSVDAPVVIEPTVNEPIVKQPQNDTIATVAVVNDQENYDIALSLVKKWAGSWSQQDVASYISHYAENYSPPRTQLTHQDWLEQRQVRLTNKKFIQIDVADFEFQEKDDNRFSVTFTQRYRSTF